MTPAPHVRSARWRGGGGVCVSPLGPGLRCREVYKLFTGVTVPFLKGHRTPRQQPGQDVLSQAKSQERHRLSVVPRLYREILKN